MSYLDNTGLAYFWQKIKTILYSANNPPPYPVTSVNGQTGAVTVQTATDAQVTNAVNTWLGENVAQETGYVLDSTLTMSNAAPPASAVGDLKSVIENVKPPLSYVINMWDYFWAGGTETLSSRVTNDATAESLYLVVSGQDGATALTVDESSPLSLSDMGTSVRRGIIEYPDGSVDLVSLCVIDNALDVYPPLKMAVSAVKIYSEGVSIHLSKAGYKYYANSFFNADKKYAQKRKAIAQYNPYTDPQPTNPLTKIGSFWWGKGVENIVAPNRRVAEHATKNYLNLSFVTGASAASPKGFEWEMVLNGKSGYFEMYLGGRDTDALTAEFATGLEFNIEFYLDGVLSESIVKKTKKCEPIRFDFADAQTGKVRMYTTGGASTYAAFLSQATWWETDEPHGMIFKTYKVPCMLMDSWGVYKDNEVQSVLETLLTVNGMSGYVVNNSLGSMTSNWGVENFYPKAWAEHPDYMITDFQINDINTGVTEAQYIQNMTNIVDASLATRIAPVLLLSAHVTMTGVYCLYTFPLITALTDIS